MEAHEVENWLGNMSIEEFTSEKDINQYFTLENITAMFGAQGPEDEEYSEEEIEEARVYILAEWNNEQHNETIDTIDNAIDVNNSRLVDAGLDPCLSHDHDSSTISDGGVTDEASVELIQEWADTLINQAEEDEDDCQCSDPCCPCTGHKIGTP